jgi:hypothetical protein
LCGDSAFHSATNRNDQIQVEEHQFACDLASSLNPNLSVFPTGCHLHEFTLRVDVSDVLDDVGTRGLEQLSNLLLTKPNGLVGEVNFDRWGTAVVTIDYWDTGSDLVSQHEIVPSQGFSHRAISDDVGQEV